VRHFALLVSINPSSWTRSAPLPEHLHCLWTLPAGDADFSSRWNRIKGLLSKRYLAANASHADPNPSHQRKGEALIWQWRFWEHCIRDTDDFRQRLEI
jgi:putative transposase